ncbi:MAG TPA: hypothetical protein VF171_09320, partial [Trueperaceae bacterium]
ALPTVALLLCDLGHEVRAVELLAMMTRYPVVEHCHWFEDIALRQLRGVAAGLPDEVAGPALARGRALELWDGVGALVAELGALGWNKEGVPA